MISLPKRIFFTALDSFDFNKYNKRYTLINIYYLIYINN